MAKINHILFGQGKGKVGGLVLQRYEGLNVVREKPISIKNPQSTAQTNQRAKFKTATQIVAQFYPVIRQRLAKVSLYDRTKRAVAINGIIAVTTNPSNETPMALADRVVAAINAKSMSDFEAPEVQSQTEGVATIVAPSGDKVFYTVVEYGADGGFINATTETYTSDGSAKEVSASGVKNVIMVTSVRARTEAGRATLGNIEYEQEPRFSGWSVEVSRGIATGDIEVSTMTGLAF